MNLPAKSNTALAENIDSIQEKELEIVQEYKDLNQKCEAVLEKINKRKNNKSKSKK